MAEEQLIDRGSYYEILNCQPTIKVDEAGNVVSVIYCPYIPKRLVEMLQTSSKA